MKRKTHCQRVLEILSDGRPHSHLELYALGTVAHSRISDLRKKGHEIHQWRNGDLYLYRLVPSLASAPDSSHSSLGGLGDGELGAEASEAALARPDARPPGAATHISEPEGQASLTLFETPRKPAWA